MKTVFLELSRSGGQCQGTCWEDDRRDARTLDDVRLGPDDPLAIPDTRPPHAEETYSLAELALMLIDFNTHGLESVFQERGQITIGQYLYQQTLGRVQRYDDQQDINLRIITEDEHLARLPWPLLAHRGLFLVSKRWAVSLVSRFESLPDVELPPLPKILMVTPEPGEHPPTDGDEHRLALTRLLEKVAPKMASADHFHAVKTWEEYWQTARATRYDVVYYYGHGEGTANESRLLFEADNSDAERHRALLS